MKEFSQEIIEVDGKQYKLFLNRKGLVSWENITKVQKQASALENKYKNVENKIEDGEPIKVDNNANPFDYAGDEVDSIDEDEKLIKDIYIKFYWIALYENHKMPLDEVEKLFYKAEEECGLEELVTVANELIENINKDKYGNKELKKLKALNQTKQIKN